MRRTFAISLAIDLWPSMLCCTRILVASSILATASARADSDGSEARLTPRTQETARAGLFLPLTAGASTSSQRTFARAYGGYDSASRAGRFESTVEATLFGPVAASITASYGERGPGYLRPGGGVRVQALSMDRHGMDLSIGVYYRAEGFSEPEGEIEGVVALAKRVRRWGMFANLVYGQDPEGRERDGELRAAVLYELSALQLGADARARVNLAGEHEPRGAEQEREAEYDFVVGPTASYTLGPIALLLYAGLRGLAQADTLHVGASALLGLAGSL